MRILAGKDDDNTLSELEKNQLADVLEKYNGYYPLPKFSFETMLEKHTLRVWKDMQFAIETFVKPSFETGYIPLTGYVHHDKAYYLSENQINAYKTFFTDYSETLSGKTPFKFHTLFFSQFENYPNKIHTLSTLRAKLNGFMEAPIRTTDRTKYENTKFAKEHSKCKGASYYVPLRLEQGFLFKIRYNIIIYLLKNFFFLY